jgi:hypothetical protein
MGHFDRLRIVGRQWDDFKPRSATRSEIHLLPLASVIARRPLRQPCGFGTGNRAVRDTSASEETVRSSGDRLASGQG